MGVIKQLKQFITGKQIYPVTKSNAVYDNIAGRLDTLLQKYVGESDSLEVTDALPRDADTLGGEEPSAFAKQFDLEEIKLLINTVITTLNKVFTTASKNDVFQSQVDSYVYGAYLSKSVRTTYLCVTAYKIPVGTWFTVGVLREEFRPTCGYISNVTYTGGNIPNGAARISSNGTVQIYNPSSNVETMINFSITYIAKEILQ